MRLCLPDQRELPKLGACIVAHCWPLTRPPPHPLALQLSATHFDATKMSSLVCGTKSECAALHTAALALLARLQLTTSRLPLSTPRPPPRSLWRREQHLRAGRNLLP